ncbi:TetR/AcrR family transcriptional regulator [Paracoccus laeviglucosivorans]|uniref:Transcriptional regulator, TetR family n=1 Tax=Paracoccus laeviglucosivorans TaxID=1197861 RepID=A0A521ETY7_9RHOB|nr:TetR/AcrR family transcriptional regulator [Paracoccus laeviglucosivorans]SMO87416.1 transcriptional regulator, TetR family [Paracoccus laeviglucosivorans]
MSGRPRSIDRDKVLDAAETIVAQTGAAGLTFDAVARAAGITKGGVQYCFGTKQQLIDAMIDRWCNAFDQDVADRVGPAPSPQDVIRGHLQATRDAKETDHSRAAVMMTALLQSPDQVVASRDWYNQRLAGLNLDDTADRRIALAFLAGEGAFLLKAFGLIGLDQPQWSRLFDDILKLAETK